MLSSIDYLRKVDWNFSDYKSDFFPADLGTLHWYPAAFVPQIPYILIEALSKPGDIVFDPFMGSGITIIEAARLQRRFIGIDRNPFAVKVTAAKLEALSLRDSKWFDNEIENANQLEQLDSIKQYTIDNKLDDAIFKWFEKKTLIELLSIHKYIYSKNKTNKNKLNETIFSSILNKCCSQREHYTYITDNCYPKEKIYRPAKEFYIEQIKNVRESVELARKFFRKLNKKNWNPKDLGSIFLGDSRSLNFLKDKSIDLIVTSPPYLGVNDYVRSMRLPQIFFPESEFDSAIEDEIGARRKRNRKYAYEDYLNDMKICFNEMARVLKKGSYLAIVLGQGRGKVNKSDIIENQIKLFNDKLGFELVFREERMIKFRRIQVPGVGKELILVLKKNNTGV